MKKQYIKALGLAILCWLASFSAMAQFGFTPLDGSCISSNGTTTYRFHVDLPGGAALNTYSNVVITTFGGIDTVGVDRLNNIVTIKSKTGIVPSSGYSKYAKGRIYISCTAPSDSRCTPCPYYNPYFSYSYDVYKIFDLTRLDNEVVGPICVTAGDTVTYSVEPWVSIDKAGIGIDRYKWTLPATLVDTILYYSADSSSITFVINQLSTTIPDSVKVQLGKCNFGSANHLSWIVLNQAVPKPIITGDLCAKSGSQSVKLWVQNKDQGATYTWSWQNSNWSIVGSSVGDTIHLTTDNFGANDVYVSASYSGGGCKPSADTISIRRGLTTGVSQMSASPNTHCVVAGSDYIYSVTTGLENKYAWTKPYGWDIVSADATKNTITLRPTLSAKSGVIGVRVDASICTESDILEYAVNIQPGNANVITGTDFCLQKGHTYSFSTTATTPAAASYKWELGQGWSDTITTNGGLTITGTATGNVISDSIRVTPLSTLTGCNGRSKAHPVAYLPTAPTQIQIIPTGCINTGVSDQLKLKALTSATVSQNYTWTLGSLGTGSSIVDSIIVTTTGVENSYPVSVVAYTNLSVCPSTSLSVDTTVTIDGYDFTAAATLYKGKYYYEVKTANGWNIGSMSYLWMLDGQDKTDYDYVQATTPVVYSDLLLSTSTHTFTVTISDGAGCTTTRVLGGPNGYDMSFNGLRSASIGNESLTDMTVSPNPATNDVTVSFTDGKAAEVKIVSMQGNVVKRLITAGGRAVFDISDLVSGTYVVTVTRNGQSISKQLIKK